MSDGKRYDPNRRVDWQPTSTVVGAFTGRSVGCPTRRMDGRVQAMLDMLNERIARRRRESEIDLCRRVRLFTFDW